MTYTEAYPDHVKAINAMFTQLTGGKPYTESTPIKNFNFNVPDFANIFRKHYYAANVGDSIYTRYTQQVPADGTIAQLRERLVAALHEDWYMGWEDVP